LQALYKIPTNARYAVLGSGSWATAIVKLLSVNLGSVSWYIRKPETADYIAQHRHNPNFLSAVEFDVSRITFYSSINEAVSGSDVLILAIPSAFVEVWLKGLTADVKDKFVVSAVKGIMPQGSETVSDYLHTALGLDYEQVGILSGPCHAEEIALERLSYLTFACQDEDNARAVAQNFAAPFVKTITTADIRGTEYAAVLKNIYAIAAGICQGLGYGDNFQAVMVSNAQAELSHFLDETFPAPRNVCHSAYLGDLLVTCYSQFSRNRTFGIKIGKGYRVRDILVEMNMVAEGYYATQYVDVLTQKYKAVLPIAQCVYRILYGDCDVRQEIGKLIDELR
jgi:glycerol-3-phosphate dehydrogenase (NAD(P)+)